MLQEVRSPPLEALRLIYLCGLVEGSINGFACLSNPGLGLYGEALGLTPELSFGSSSAKHPGILAASLGQSQPGSGVAAARLRITYTQNWVNSQSSRSRTLYTGSLSCPEAG